MQAIVSLMVEPNVEKPIVPEIGDLYKSNKQKFDSTAKQWTNMFAK